MQFLCHTNNLISKHFQYQTRVIALDCSSNVNKVNQNGNPPSGNHTVTNSTAHEKMVKGWRLPFCTSHYCRVDRIEFQRGG